MRSVVPAAANGTTTLTGLLGHSCASTAWLTTTTSAASAPPISFSPVISPPRSANPRVRELASLGDNSQHDRRLSRPDQESESRCADGRLNQCGRLLPERLRSAVSGGQESIDFGCRQRFDLQLRL